MNSSRIKVYVEKHPIFSHTVDNKYVNHTAQEVFMHHSSYTWWPQEKKVHPRHTSWNWKACKWRLQVVFKPLDRNVLCRRLLNTCFNWKSNSSFESFTSLSYWMTARLWALSKVSVNGGTKGKIQWRMNTKWSTRSLFSPPEGGSPYETANSTKQQKLGVAPNVRRGKKPFLIHHKCIAQGNSYPDRYSVTHPKTDPANSWRTKPWTASIRDFTLWFQAVCWVQIWVSKSVVVPLPSPGLRSPELF